jgi:hypothetical protein
MKHGCMVMTLRLSTSCRSGSRQIHRVGKKGAPSSQECQVYVDLFSTSKKSSTKNSYLLVKPSMATFTVRFWSGWAREFGANFQTSGRTTIGFSTMTTRPLTHHSLFDSSWLPKKLQWLPTPHSPEHAPCDFFLFPKMILRLKGCRFDKTDKIHAESQQAIDTLTFENFQGCIISLETRWDRFIHAQGDYFDGDGEN